MSLPRIAARNFSISLCDGTRSGSENPCVDAVLLTVFPSISSDISASALSRSLLIFNFLSLSNYRSEVILCSGALYVNERGKVFVFFEDIL